MGLDCTAYRNLKKIECSFDEDGEPIDSITKEYLGGTWLKAYDNSDFPGRIAPLEDGVVYGAEEAEDDMCWHGGYGRYNGWRRELARFAGYPATSHTLYGNTEMRHDAGAWAVTNGPFWELINFADNEGTIGTTACAKLAKDFQEHQARLDASDDYSLDFKEGYALWRNSFEFAAEDGAINFH